MLQENIKPIINYLFENFRPRLDALSTRPFLRGFLQGLTTRWEQNNEPPPAPPAAEAESSKWANRAAEVEEEEYFNASDEEEIGPKPPVKRKRVVTYGGGHTKKRSGGALGLDYDDGSDSEGSNGGQSPRIPMGPRKEDAPPTPGTASEELEGDLGDVAMRMRAKRLREEEEEEGFAGMMAGKAAATTPKKEKETKKEKENVGGGGKREGTPIKEKKIRLNFGALGKKLGGGGGR